jgi:hypothetical protein
MPHEKGHDPRPGSPAASDDADERRREQPEPVAGPGSREAVTGSGDQDVTRRTGPGTGGATETAGRMPHHEGVHGRRSAKG